MSRSPEQAAPAAATAQAPCAAKVPAALEVRSLCCGYGGKPVLQDVSFSLPAGGLLVLLGPNGVGKTTLFRTILGFLPVLGGTVLIDGEDVSGASRKRIARSVAYVPQTHESAFGFTVREMVLMGRTPHLEGLAAPTREDEAAAEAVLGGLGLDHLAARDCTSLSGGEMQMVLVARALAQDPRILVMDEPCANLDLGNQVRVLEQMRSLAQRGIAVIATSHDPNHALQLRSEAVCLARGGEVLAGAGAELLDARMLSALYGADVGIGSVTDARGATGPACAPVMAATQAQACAQAGAETEEQVPFERIDGDIGGGTPVCDAA